MKEARNPVVNIVVVNLVVVRREIHDNDKPARASMNRALSLVMAYSPVFIKVVGLVWKLYCVFSSLNS
jgi:hypothetical protein